MKHNEIRSASTKLVVAGIVLMAAGALVIVLLPTILDLMNVGATSQGQSIRAAVELALRILREAAMPLGGALLAAGITVRVLSRHERESDRTERIMSSEEA